VTRIAHLSDIHLGVSPERRWRLDRALAEAARAGASHLCLTGDLTESGLLRDFESLSDALRPWHPSAVTIVPGNHDLGALSWPEVLRATDLGRFAPTSTPGHVSLPYIGLSNPNIAPAPVAVMALSTQYPKRALVFRALGNVPEDQLRDLEYVAQHYPLVIACMHHPPLPSGWLELFDGLTNRKEVSTLLDRCPNVHVLAGHAHEARDVGRVHVASALADDPGALRLYDIISSPVPGLVPVR